MAVRNRKGSTRSTIAGSLTLATGLTFLGCGQGGPPPETVEFKKATLESSETVAACLPSGVTLETKTTDKDGGSETVEETLARLKATPKRGKLYDLGGREIVFHKPTATGRAILNDPVYKKLSAKRTIVLLAP